VGRKKKEKVALFSGRGKQYVVEGSGKKGLQGRLARYIEADKGRVLGGAPRKKKL